MTEEQTIEKLEQENEDYQETIRELRREIADVRVARLKLEEDNRELRREIAGLKHEIVHLTGTHNRLTRSK